jgi:hypothetical protein
MAVDYLKTYLGIDPNDYSSMESRIRGEEPQARTPVMMRQPMMMPQQRSLGDIEAMQMMPRQQPAPQPAPQVDDRYQGLMDQIAALRSQIEGMQAPTEQAPVGAEAPVMADTPTEVNMDDAREMFYQSPEFKEYQRQTEGMAHDMAYRPQNYTDPTTGNTVSFQDRSGLFQDWYKNTYGRDLAVEDNSFRGSLGSGLGGILDESNSIQAPVGTEQPPLGSNNSFDYRQEMETTPPERPNYNSFRADPDTGFLQISNPDAEGILKYGNDPRRLEFLKPQYDEYLNLFDSLQARDRYRHRLTPEGMEKRRQEEARFKELYNMFGVIGTGGAYTPMQLERDGSVLRSPENIQQLMANDVYSKYVIDQPERTPPTQTEMPTTYQAFNPITGKMETLPIPANMQMPGMPLPGISGIPNPMTGETSEGMPYQPEPSPTPGYDTLSPNQPTQGLQAPPEIENRAVGEPEPMPQAPAEDIQASIDYLAKLPKMNIPQIPDIEEIKRKMAEANMNFPEPVSYQDQLQAIRDLPPMNQMPTREEIQMAMQNMPTPTAPVSSMPKFNLPQMQSFGLPQQIAGGRTLMSDFSPRNVMRMASGGGIDKAIYDLKFKLNGS